MNEDGPVGNSCAVNSLDNTPASTKREPSEFGSESELEAAIESAKQLMCDAPDRDGKMRHWREMCRLIDLRSPSRRRFMARMRGLA